MERQRLPAKFSGWFFIRAIAEKVGKTDLNKVTPKDFHQFAHLENILFTKEHPEGEKIPPIFEEQISLKLAKEILKEPSRIWENA